MSTVYIPKHDNALSITARCVDGWVEVGRPPSARAVLHPLHIPGHLLPPYLTRLTLILPPRPGVMLSSVMPNSNELGYFYGRLVLRVLMPRTIALMLSFHALMQHVNCFHRLSPLPHLVVDLQGETKPPHPENRKRCGCVGRAPSPGIRVSFGQRNHSFGAGELQPSSAEEKRAPCPGKVTRCTHVLPSEHHRRECARKGYESRYLLPFNRQVATLDSLHLCRPSCPSVPRILGLLFNRGYCVVLRNQAEI